MQIEDKDISVVVQGGISKKYTYNCLKSIRKYLPNSELIISTWKGQDLTHFDCDKTILNIDPGAKRQFYDKDCYNSNVVNNGNRQLISTQSGIQGSTRKYILKLRTDHLLLSSDFLHFFGKFSERKIDYSIFTHKVLVSSIYSREFADRKQGNGLPTPFHPSDFWFFGLREDIEDYFMQCPLQTEEESGNWSFKFPDRKPYAQAYWRFPPEQHFCVNWLKKHDVELNFYDLSDWSESMIQLSNNLLYNNFIFLNCNQSGIICPKHLSSELTSDNLHFAN